ncbi:F-box only protein 47-like [Acropora palmata]|uniref:F-box only protein 47-like n=1 Tax=Acropora palmata TaxID=6131 RepID=UPI003DA01A4E
MSVTMCHYMKSVKKSRKNKNAHLKTPRTVSTGKRQRNFEQPECSFTSLGLFDALPREMRFGIFGFTLPADLGQLSLTSRKFRDEIMEYIHNNEALLLIVPHIHAKREKGSSEIFITMETEYCCSHFKQLGILLKRATCLFSTKERLKEVGIILDKLKDTHSRICSTLGSDIAYSCYGKFLHSFVAGWEDDEKFKAYLAIKGASCLDDRIRQVLRSLPGSQPWYERYIRVFCREIFLDKSSDLNEKGFWLCKILKPWPLVFQARLLYIIYGPVNEDNGTVDWHAVEICPTFFGVEDAELEELATALKILHFHCDNKDWNLDDFLSVFEELTGIPTDWCMENVAKLLKLCGESVCHEVLGNKAINGRIHEISYLGYYLGQVLGQDDIMCGKGTGIESFTKTVKHILAVMQSGKDQATLVSSLFNVWEENILSLGEGMQEEVDVVTPEEQEQVFAANVHNLCKMASILLQECAEN